jgi:ribosomal protein L11 methyltransferase
MFELVLICPQDRVEALSDALDALDALSVSVEDADAHTDAEQALFGEPGMPAPKNGWQRSRVLALFASESLAKDALRLLQAQVFFAGCQVLAIRAVPDEDWVRLTQSQFSPVEITADFWIVPTWHEPPAAARTVIRLDPGLAFGTGTHPTTRMCLRWIARMGADVATHKQAPWGPVLDYGCGSGILAIGAAKFGALEIDAVDIDPAAVESTVLNASANHVTLSAGLPDKVRAGYQVVLANILATPLKVLAPLLCAKVQMGGHLILAGILERQAQELTDAYRPYLALTVSDSQEGWVLMTAKR